MRWYCVLCLRASFLKNWTLRLLREMVTFTPSSRNTRSSGRGRKSGTTFRSPRGSSVYLILSPVDSLSCAQITGSVDGNHVLTVSEPHCEDASTHLAKTVVPRFAGAVRQVFRDDALRVNERELRQREGDAVLFVVLVIFVQVPVEPGPSPWHKANMDMALWPYGRME